MQIQRLHAIHKKYDSKQFGTDQYSVEDLDYLLECIANHIDTSLMCLALKAIHLIFVRINVESKEYNRCLLAALDLFKYPKVNRDLHVVCGMLFTLIYSKTHESLDCFFTHVDSYVIEDPLLFRLCCYRAYMVYMDKFPPIECLEFLLESCSRNEDQYVRIIAFDAIRLYCANMGNKINKEFVEMFLNKHWYEKLDLLNQKIKEILSVYLESLPSQDQLWLLKSLIYPGFACSRKSLIWLDSLMKMIDVFESDTFNAWFFDELCSASPDSDVGTLAQQLIRTCIQVLVSKDIHHELIVYAVLRLFTGSAIRLKEVVFKSILQLLPYPIFSKVIDELKTKSNSNYAVLYMARYDIDKNARDPQTIFPDLFEFVKSCLVHKDPSVRLDALALICDRAKTNVLVTEVELDWILWFLKYNIRNINAEIRHCVMGHMKKFINRVGKCILKSKKQIQRKAVPPKDRNGEKVHISSTTLKILRQFESVDPEVILAKCEGFGMELKSMILKSLRPGSPYHKTVTALKILVVCLSCTPACFPIDVNLYRAVHTCCFSTFIDIREYSIELLTLMDSSTNFYHQLQHELFNIDNITRLLDSPQAHESETAVLLLNYYIENSKIDTLSWISTFMNQISQLMKTSDIELNAVDNPFQGKLISLKCLVMRMNRKGHLDENLHSELVDFLILVCEYVGDVLKSASPEGYFSEATDEQEGDEDVFSEAFNSVFKKCQFLSCFCWRSMKEAVELLTYLSVERLKVDNKDCLALKVTEYIMELLLTVRHCGAFNHVYPNFAHICKYHSYEVCRKLLMDILDDIKDGKSSAALGITRRSGGIPLAIVSLILNEQDLHCKRLLNECLKELFDMCEVEEDHDVEDAALPPLPVRCKIHSLNCLKVIAAESALKADLNHSVVSSLFKICLKGLSSKSWMIRNSSTMLYTVLVQRVFGKMNSKSYTATDFFKLYEDLHPFIVCELKKIDNSATLYPILLLLSRFSISKKPLSEFVELLLPYRGHHHHRVRCMASKAICSFVDNPEMLATRLKSDVSNAESANLVNGSLLMLLNLKQSFAIEVDLDISKKLCDPNLALVAKIQAIEPCSFSSNHHAPGNVDLSKHFDTLNLECYEAVIEMINREFKRANDSKNWETYESLYEIMILMPKTDSFCIEYCQRTAYFRFLWGLVSQRNHSTVINTAVDRLLGLEITQIPSIQRLLEIFAYNSKVLPLFGKISFVNEQILERIEKMVRDEEPLDSRILCANFYINLFRAGFRLECDDLAHFRLVFAIHRLLLDDNSSVREIGGEIVALVAPDLNLDDYDYSYLISVYFEVILKRFNVDGDLVLECLKEEWQVEEKGVLFKKEPLNTFIDYYEYRELLNGLLNS